MKTGQKTKVSTFTILVLGSEMLEKLLPAC